MKKSGVTVVSYGPRDDLVARGGGFVQRPAGLLLVDLPRPRREAATYAVIPDRLVVFEGRAPAPAPLPEPPRELAAPRDHKRRTRLRKKRGW